MSLFNFNPRAPYGARRVSFCWQGCKIWISIHAPHTGRDMQTDGENYWKDISIHAPHTGRDNVIWNGLLVMSLFQSTRPIRGATWRCPSASFLRGYFNPRAPYGARPSRPARRTRTTYFNPRAPYGARPRSHSCSAATQRFQSTRPIRGATFMLGTLRATREFQSTRPIRGATTVDV